LCLTRFYRDPAISVAWSGEATRYLPWLCGPDRPAGPMRGPVLEDGIL